MSVMRKLFSRSDTGQTLILFAVLAPIIVGIVGLAVDGGAVFVQYKRLQDAADLAAYVGAQDIPCAIDGTGTSCINQAEQDACANANANGYDCVAGASQPSASNVPPVSCSPYDFADYGNGPSDPSPYGNPSSQCKNLPASSNLDYIEVRLTKSVPIPVMSAAFQLLGAAPLAVNLYAHAVAKHGVPSNKDYAITLLDPSGVDMDLTGSTCSNNPPTLGLIVVGSIISDSTSASSIKTGGSCNHVSCGGKWFTAANESYPGNLGTNDTGIVGYSPPNCVGGSTSYPGGEGFQPNQQPVRDPYGTSSPPAVSTTGQVFWWSGPTDRNGTGTNHGWIAGNDNGVSSLNKNNVEFFPGIYTKKIHITSANRVYFNPGVYEFTNGFDMTANPTVCIFGAPVCDDSSSHPIQAAVGSATLTCGNATFSTSDSGNNVKPGEWYYFCSPWGFYDQRAANGTLPAQPADGTGGGITTALRTVPMFSDGLTPLNGVSIYLPSQNTSFAMTGSGSMSLAAPNPCPGKGSETTHNVSFYDEADLASPLPSPIPNLAPFNPSGYYSSSMTNYIAQPASADGTTAPPTYDELYPSVDYTVGGECPAASSYPVGSYTGTPTTNAGNAWIPPLGQIGEFDNPPYQHLQFLIFARSANSNISLGGGGYQSWWGIIYNHGGTLTSACGNSCTVSLSGSAGANGGVPMLMGQVVADNLKFAGNASVEVYYRPCFPSTACLSGPGSALVQ